MQQTGTGTGHWALDQYVSPKNSIKSCQKYMKVVEYWHGTIENYRYDGDVSMTMATDSPLRSPERTPDQPSRERLELGGGSVS